MIEIEKKRIKSYTFYYIKGTKILHREDGPAVVYPNGRFEWWVNGQRHRVDGPAAIWLGVGIEWYIDGIYFPTKEAWFDALTEEQKEKALQSEYFIRG